MTKHPVLLTFICFLFACHSQEDKNSYAGLIKGDWLGSLQNQNYVNQTLFACFEDSTYQNTIEQDTFKYEVRKDTLYLQKADDDEHLQLAKFPIVKLTADSLILLNGPRLEHTIRFSKVRAKNTITPDTIRFSSSGCYGSCPITYLEIDSSRNFRFFGGWHTSMKGGFRGKISESQYKSIINKIKNLPIDSLHKFYEASWTDDATMGVSIIHGNTTTNSAAYGHDREPMELYLLFAKLINVYKHVNLQPDPTLNQDYFFWNYNIMNDLMPMPERFFPPKIVPEKHK